MKRIACILFLVAAACGDDTSGTPADLGAPSHDLAATADSSGARDAVPAFADLTALPDATVAADLAAMPDLAPARDLAAAPDAAPHAIAFAPYVAYATGGTQPTPTVAVDFNQDGKLDLATGNRGSSNIGVMLGNGDGTFKAATTLVASGTEPQDLAAGDVDGDGHLDLVSTSHVSGAISVFLGLGDGTFKAPIATAAAASFLALTDLDGDGKLDVVYTTSDRSGLAVQLGHGDGTFAAAVTTAVQGQPFDEVLVGDLNGDGKRDVVISAFDGNTMAGIAVLLNQGGGTLGTPTFTAAGVISTIGHADAPALGDLDGDGKLDVVVPFDNMPLLATFLGKGDGTFTLAATMSSLTQPASSLALGDLDGDGKLDVAAAYLTAACTCMEYARGNGDGTFSGATEVALDGYSRWVTLGDFNQDGRLDVAAPTSSAMDILLAR